MRTEALGLGEDVNVNDSITMRLTHPTLPPGRVEGFALIWAFYVKGFNPEKQIIEEILERLA